MHEDPSRFLRSKARILRGIPSRSLSFVVGSRQRSNNSENVEAHLSASRRYLATLPQPRLRLYVILILSGLIVCFLFVGHSTYTAYQAYRGIEYQMAVLNTLAERDPTQLSEADLLAIEIALTELGHDLRRLDAATTIPLGGDQFVERLPWVGPHQDAGRTLLQLGMMLTDAGAASASIGREVLAAYEATGINAESPPEHQTWLDVVSVRQHDLNAIASQINAAKQLRSEINSDLLPRDVRQQLITLDSMLGRLDTERLVGQYLPALGTAFGAEGNARYLVLFQNPDELRPSGGFPGTAALVSLERGQLRGYEFFDSHELTRDYMAQRRQKLPQPWPIQEYFPQDGFLLHDATWFANFPDSGAQVMAMYAETDWPAIDGVVAIDPAVVGDILRITGPITLEVDGDARTFTAENVHENIERQRLLQRDEYSTHHKELIAVLGKEILRRLTNADRVTVGQVAKSLINSLGRRDIQIYASDDGLQSILDAHHWSGRLVPDPDVPTLSVTFANVALGKSSQFMIPRLEMRLDPVRDGTRQVNLRFQLEHTGSNEMHPFYGGFQRWWIDVALPHGSVGLQSSPAPMQVPEPVSGGSYVIDLFPGQTGDLSIQVEMPDEDRLLLRRQPGLRSMEVVVIDSSCGSSFSFVLSVDMELDLTKVCRRGSGFLPTNPFASAPLVHSASSNSFAYEGPCRQGCGTPNVM